MYSGQGLCNSFSHNGQSRSLLIEHLGDLVEGQLVPGGGEVRLRVVSALLRAAQQGFLLTGAVFMY